MKAAHGFLVLSALSLCLPTYAQVDSTEVKKAEDRFQRFKAIRGVNDKDYPFQLTSLAGTYQKNSQRVKSEALYQQALRLAKKQGIRQTIDLMNYRAGQLYSKRRVYSFPNGTDRKTEERFINNDRLEHEKDIEKCIAVLTEAKKLSQKLPITDRLRFTAQSNLISYTRWHINPGLAHKEEQELLAFARTKLKETKSPEEVYVLAGQIGALGVQNASGDNRNVPYAIKLNEEYLSQIDRLPKTDPRRIRAHRQAIKWYRRIGREDFAQHQTKQLAQLLGTNDLNKLFPPKRRCLGCGMG